jgi:hypothetical protein
MMPQTKPGFNPVLLLSALSISRCVLRMSLVRSALVISQPGQTESHTQAVPGMLVVVAANVQLPYCVNQSLEASCG